MPSVTVSPDPAAPGASVDVLLAGFSFKTMLTMRVDGGYSDWKFRTERNGTLETSLVLGSTVGEHTIDVYAYRKDGNYVGINPLASTIFHIEADTEPPVEPPPVEPPPATTLVSSIAGLLSALADNTVTDITVRNGTYAVAGAGLVQSNSLWINERFAARTNPVTVHAETKGGVIFDGAGSTTNAIAFVAGAHDQTWDGFTFANIAPTLAAVIMFGGFDSQAGKPPARKITMKNITGVTNIVGNGQTAHMVYLGHPTPTDIVLDDFTVKGSGTSGITALHSYHDPNARNLTARRWNVSNVYRGMLLWSDMTGFLAEDWTITGAGMSVDIRTVKGTLRRITATSSGAPSIPSTITQESCSWAEPANETLVTSVPALLAALDDNNVTAIVVKNGRYLISTAAKQATNSLWIASRYADRTKPVTVRAETKGGVIFDAQGAFWMGGITFTEGAHDQTWDGFVFENGTPASGTGDGTGVFVIGGYSGRPATHHISVKNCTVRGIIGQTTPHGHAVYFSWSSSPGPHDIVFENLTVEDAIGTMGSAVQWYHSDASNPNAYNVIIRGLKVTGTQQAIMLWDSTIHDILIEDSTITGAKQSAVRYEYGNGIILRRVVSTNSGQRGFYSSKGTNPPGITFEQCSFG